VLFGLAMFPADYAAPPHEVARLVEQHGFDSLLFPEHTHIPVSRDTPYPAGGELPGEYSHTLDPFVACTAAAMATTTLKVGTGICLVVERDPIVTAKEAASVDHLSGGRFLFGVGAGWNVEEMANHGTDASKRFGLMHERVEAIKAIWTQDEAEYHGKRVDFDPIWSWPKPVQKPHPPVLVGGNGKTAPERVLAFGDEWMPNRVGDDEKIAARIAKLIRRGHDEAGRDIGVTLAVAPTEPAQIELYEQAGVHRCQWYLPPRDLDSVERALGRYAAAVAAYGA
jgi:probable F420-dependent oxidoreductase